MTLRMDLAEPMYEKWLDTLLVLINWYVMFVKQISEQWNTERIKKGQIKEDVTPYCYN